jgi:hypothetical protein
MKSRRILGLAAFASASLLSAHARTEPKLLNRSIYLPMELSLCEHLEKAVLYQDDQPVSTMPARRVFQFTYYPDLERVLPEVVQVRVEGAYVGGGEPFIAKLAVTPGGIHTAHGTKALHTGERILRQRHKIDVRLEPIRLELDCERFCRRTTVFSTNQ